MSSRPLVDGEYDPVAAAAHRAALARRVRLARQKRLDDAQAKKDAAAAAAAAKKAADKLAAEKAAQRTKETQEAERKATQRFADEKAAKLKAQKDEAAKKAAADKRKKMIASYKKVAAKRLADKKAAEKKAAKKLPDPKKFKGIPGPGAGPAPGSPGAKIQAGIGKTISQIQKSATKRAAPIKKAGLKSQEGISGILNYWAAKNDKLYEKGNFMTPAEKAEVLEEVQKNPFLAYDIMTGTKPEKPPKTFDEAINRMNYMVSEAALGGAREVALPFSMKAGKPRRTEDALLQVVGGLLTPSPADLLVSTAFRKLAAQGQKGTNLLKKVLRGTTMTSDEALQFERMVGEGGYSTADLRKLGENLGPQNIDMLWNEMQGIPMTAAQARKFEKLVGQSGFSTSDLRNLSKVVQEADTSLFQKIMKGVPMTQDEALEFEKLVGQYGYSTSDLRKAGTTLNKLSQAEWDDLMRAYNKHNEFWKANPELYGSGAAYKPALLQEFGEILDDLGYDAGEYIDFLKANKLGPTFNPATLAAFASGVKPPVSDLKAYDKIMEDLIKYRESQKEMLEELQEKPVISGPIPKEKAKLEEPIEPGYTPPTEVQEEEEEEALLPGYTPPPLKEVVKKPVPTEPGVTPPIEEEEEVTKIVTLPDVPVPTEAGAPDEPEPPLTDKAIDRSAAAIPIPRKEKGKMPRNIFRALVGGKSEEYRVKFDYPRSDSESFTVKARSFPQALGQAQGLRKVRKSPSEVDIVQMEVKS